MDLTPILEAVANEYDICPAEITTRTRRQPIAAARQLVIYLLRHTTDLTLEDIGRSLGRHHSTVIHAINTIEGRRIYDTALNQRIRHLTKEITPPAPQIPCLACQGKDKPDKDTAGSSTTKGEPRASSQPCNTQMLQSAELHRRQDPGSQRHQKKKHGHEGTASSE